MNWLIGFILSFALIRMLVALFNLISMNWLKNDQVKANEKVSVLIPARDEQEKLPALLESLQDQKYLNIEVIVYDDQSVDKTAEIIIKTSKKDNRFKYLKGDDLPDGWLGKNHACHKLAQAAQGEYLLFLDADVLTGPELIGQSLSFLKQHNLSLLSIFPIQKLISFSERISVPVMNWILVSLLPMLLIRKSRWTSLSAANGQFMLFNAVDYKNNWFHMLLKNEKVEDIRIMQLMKKKRYRVHTLLGNKQISCRMYNTYKESVYGFSKNVVAYFGGSYIVTLGFVLITTFGWLPLVLSGQIELFIMYLSILILTRIFVSAASKQNPLLNVLLMPLQQLSFVLFVMQSIKNKLSGQYTWKNRPIVNS